MLPTVAIFKFYSCPPCTCVKISLDIPRTRQHNLHEALDSLRPVAARQKNTSEIFISYMNYLTLVPHNMCFPLSESTPLFPVTALFIYCLSNMSRRRLPDTFMTYTEANFVLSIPEPLFKINNQQPVVK